MKRKSRYFTLEFKQKAVELSYARGSVKEVSEELDFNSSVLHRWRKELKSYGKNSLLGRGTPKMRSVSKVVCELKYNSDFCKKQRLELSIDLLKFILPEMLIAHFDLVKHNV